MNQSRIAAVNDTRNESLNHALTDSPPTRAPADQGAGNREQGSKEVAGNSNHPTSRNACRHQRTMDGPSTKQHTPSGQPRGPVVGVATRVCAAAGVVSHG